MDVAYINRIISTTEKINLDSIETYTEDYHAADFGNNDQINKQATIELIGDAVGTVPFVISLPSGSAFPTNILGPALTGFLAGFTGFTQKMIITDIKNRYINDVVIDENWTDNTQTELESIDIYGHDSGDGATTIDDLIITLF